MPSLLRFIVVAAVLAGLAYAGLFALAQVKPTPRPMEQAIPASRFK